MSEPKMRPLAAPAASLMLAVCGVASAQQSTTPVQDAVNTAPAQTVTINEYVVRGNTVLDARTIERAVTPFLGPQRTLDDVEAARAALQLVYQEQGYQSVYVDLPDQQVSGGVVFLTITETKVGGVEVVGARHNDPQALLERLPALQSGTVPNFSRVEKELTALNLTAKRQVVPLPRLGEVEGTIDVQLQVEDRSPWNLSLTVNNDHSADTDDLRSILSVGHDNLWQKEHAASLSWFIAPQSLDQVNVLSASYAMPLGPQWTLEFSGYHSDSDVLTAGNTQVTGRGHAMGVKLNRTLAVDSAWWHQLSLGVEFRDRDEKVLSVNEPVSYAPLKYAPITLGYSGFRQGERHAFGTGVQLVFGTRSLLGYGDDAWAWDWARYKSDPSFFALKLDVSDTWRFTSGAQLVGRLSTQVTDGPVASGEQLAAGGMYTVRGYLSAESLGDYGALGSIEWRSKPLQRWGLNDWRGYAFVEGAWLKLKDALAEQNDEFSLGSVGVGSSFQLLDLIDVRLDYGYPLRDAAHTDKGQHRWNFSVGTRF